MVYNLVTTKLSRDRLTDRYLADSGVWRCACRVVRMGRWLRLSAGLTTGMALLEPGFAVAPSPAARIGRLRPPPGKLDPRVDAAVDAVLRESGLEIVELGAVD